MMKSLATVAGLAAAVSAFTQPVQPPTYGSLLTPDLSNPLIAGQSFDITWTPKQPSAGVTVSLVLCKGPSTNCVLQDTAIVEGIPASAAKYTWSVPCSLSAGVQNTATGYGMLVIVDGTGEFQYSTQFSVQKGASCSSSSSTASSVTSSVKSSTTGGTQYTDAGSSWIRWTSSSTTLNSTISATPTAISSTKYTFAPVTTTSAIVTSTRSSTTPAASTAAASTTTTTSASARASTFTGGAAAAPTAFAKAFGAFGAAILAGLVL